jgi:hypothetical protein
MYDVAQVSASPPYNERPSDRPPNPLTEGMRHNFMHVELTFAGSHTAETYFQIDNKVWQKFPPQIEKRSREFQPSFMIVLTLWIC